MNKKTLFLILFSVLLVLPSVSLAAKTLLDIVNELANQLKLLSAGLATIAFVVSGIMFLTATGNPSRMTIAKGSLVAAIIGIVLVVLAGGAEFFVKNLTGL